MSMDWWKLVDGKDQEGSIKSWVNYAKLPVEAIVDQAEALICQRLRVIGMRALKTGTLAQGASELDISADRFLSPRVMFWTGDHRQKVTFRQQEMFEISRNYDSDNDLSEGTPTDATHNRSTIYFNMKADEALTYRLWFYQRPQPLSESNPTNLLTTDYPHLMQEACLAIAYRYRKDMQRRKEALATLADYIQLALVDSDMADETAEYNMHWNGEGGGAHQGF